MLETCIREVTYSNLGFGSVSTRGLINGVVNISDYVVSNDTMISEWWLREDMEGSDWYIIRGTAQEFAWMYGIK
jgi:hypothetical protein